MTTMKFIPLRRRVSVLPSPLRDNGAAVSIIIPCFNYGRYLPQAVESALQQDGVRTSVIIVDDASTDDSLEVAHSLAAKSSHVTVIANERNLGPVATFNNGLARAEGEFLVRLDADDMLTPGSLARAVAVMQAFPSVGLVYGHPLHFSETPPHPRTRATSWTLWPGREWLWDRCRNACNVITSPEVVMRKSVVDLIGGQQPLAHTHDMEMWLRISAFSDVAYIHGADQAWHRDHPDSLSAKHVDILRDLLERRDAFNVLFSGPAGEIPDAVEMHRTALRAIATDAVELASRQYDKRTPNFELIARYRQIALAMSPDPTSLRGWKGLERRMVMGPTRARWHFLFVAERAFRGIKGRINRWRWHTTGV